VTGRKSLQELVDELPAEERKELYERVKRSLSLQTDESRKIYHAELPRDRRAELIQQEIQSLGLWARFVYWLMRLLSHRPDEEVFLRYKMGRMRRTISGAGTDLVDFVEKFLLPEAGRRLFSLYQAAYPIIPMFRLLWTDTDFLQEMVSFLLERRIPDAKTEINQFMPMKEMQDLFMQTEKKQSIRNEVMARLERYLSALQPDMFAHLEEGLLPLYYLKGLCLFPYDEFYSMMGADLGYSAPEKIPELEAVRILDIEHYLEELYYAIYSTHRLPKNVIVHSELLEYYVDNSEQERIALIGVVAGSEGAGEPEEVEAGDDEEASEEAPEGDDEGSDARQQRISSLRKALRSAKDQAERLHRSLPIADIIKYFREDPYYRFLVYVPRLNLREYYASALTVSILGQLESRFEDVRMGVIGRMITHIFGTEPPEFENFRSSSFAWVKGIGLPTIRYVKSVNILYNYIRLHYFGELHELVQALSRIIPARYREEQSSMVFHAAGLEDLMDKIHAFDLSFSPDTDEGKSLIRMRTAMEKDPSLQRSFRIIMAQKDRDARSLLDKGAEHIQGLQNAFSNLRQAREPALSGRLAQYQGVEGVQRDGDSLLARYIETFVFLRKLLNQLIAMEEGY